MKKILNVIVFLLVVSCSSNKPIESDVNFGSTNAKDVEINIDLIATDMASLDSRIRAKMIRKENIKDFSVLDTSSYLNKVSQYQDPSEIDYIEYLKAEDIEVVTQGHKLNFAICTRSKKFKFVLCDEATSPMIDFVSEDLSIDLDKKTTDLLLN